MGIKGIYPEIGPGRRVSLAKLAVEQLEKTGRPLRLAIDISIWQFQVQVARGGSNPAIRTLFYRLVRLLGHSIQPIFVFDGPKRPAFKRNKRSTSTGDPAAKGMAKRLIRLFGFTAHDAPGEAEAECALLQREGIVDAVLSEDVDTIMFGCTKTLRQWTSEGRGSKTPTHVTLYDVEELRQGESGLDREGMVLVALMSGGDYLPAGIARCGVKVACEAAKAGFGRSLCQIKMANKAALDSWRKSLRHELETNESGYFRTRHKALEIPEAFPDMDTLRYYTHPVVSQRAPLAKLASEFPSRSPANIPGLRHFVEETFDWTYRVGAVKLIRVLAPSLLAQTLVSRSEGLSSPDHLDSIQKQDESALVKAISSRRCHFSTDGTPELRMSFVPLEIVKLDLDAEQQEETTVSYGRDGLALNSDDEYEEEAADEAEVEGRSGPASKAAFDPSKPCLAWVPESMAKMGVPIMVGEWADRQEKRQKAKDSRAAAKPARRTRSKAKDMPAGALDKFLKVSKPNNASGPAAGLKLTATQRDAIPFPQARPPMPVSASDRASPPHLKAASSFEIPTPTKPRPAARSKKPTRSPPKIPTATNHPKAGTTPWTLASLQDSSPRVPPPRTPGSAPGSSSSGGGGDNGTPPKLQPIVIASSPASGPSPSAPGSDLTHDKRRRSPPLEDPFTLEPLSEGGPITHSPRKRRSSSSIGAVPTPTKAKSSQTGQSSQRARSRGRGRGGRKAGDTTSRGAGQMSIKKYGVLTEAKGSEVSSKGSAQIDPIELSEDESGDGNNTNPRQPALRPPAAQGLKKPSPNPVSDDSCSASLDDGRGSLPWLRDLPEAQPRAGQGDDNWWEEEALMKKKKVYVPRTSDVGYFKEVEVTAQEAERLSGGAGAKSRAVLRYSDVSIVDLTSAEGHGYEKT